ncbi:MULTISPECIES: ParA family protein [Alphaproteobacteria]|jgi:chromosome partitioning protein|uniref:Chromosome partitioning protein ParA n=1 Tax=Maricaulis virginensis TaxID=144022 RepID=A0A9W6IQ21_9PROT|nr:ParA family protein [Maricaulis virginensis]GLK53524.1 chromosome partitioning protein ParA [Maricaulis virginensis]
MSLVIVFASSKGGAGKTTAATVLASELSRRAPEGMTVSLIDADPNQHSAGWAKRGDRPANLRLVENSNETTILDDIETESETSGYVLVDLEGTASATVASAIIRADFVITLCQGSQDDADEAAKTIRLIRNQSRLIKNTIPFAVLFTRTSNAIVPRTYRYIREQFAEAGIPMFDTQLTDREAFRAMRSFGGSVHTLDPEQVSGLEKAKRNVEELGSEMLRRLRDTTAPANKQPEAAHD